MSEQEKSKVSKETKAKTKKSGSKWFKDLKSEINKIVWPTKSEVVNNTTIVLGAVLIAVVIISGLDFAFQFVSDTLIKLG